MSALRDALRDLSEDVFFDLLEGDEAYLLVLDVPGVSADSLDLSVEEGQLAIEARRQKDLPEDYHYVAENRSLFFDVDLPLPDDAAADTAEATVERGVLELQIPKRDPVSETTIDVVDRDREQADDADSAGDTDPESVTETDAETDTDPESVTETETGTGTETEPTTDDDQSG